MAGKTKSATGAAGGVVVEMNMSLSGSQYALRAKEVVQFASAKEAQRLIDAGIASPSDGTPTRVIAPVVEDARDRAAREQRASEADSARREGESGEPEA